MRHNLTDSQALSLALKAGNARWFWNRRMFRKQGGTSTAELEVFATDINGNRIPDLHLFLTKSVN